MLLLLLGATTRHVDDVVQILIVLIVFVVTRNQQQSKKKLNASIYLPFSNLSIYLFAFKARHFSGRIGSVQFSVWILIRVPVRVSTWFGSVSIRFETLSHV